MIKEKDKKIINNVKECVVASANCFGLSVDELDKRLSALTDGAVIWDVGDWANHINHVGCSINRSRYRGEETIAEIVEVLFCALVIEALS